MSDNSKFYSQPRGDGASIVGDAVSGMPNWLDNPVVPLRRAIEASDVIAAPPCTDGVAHIVGDLGSGDSPNPNDPRPSARWEAPEIPPVEWNKDGSPKDPTRQL